MIFTHGLTWAMINTLICGFSSASLTLLALSFILRVWLAMTVGAEILGDEQVHSRLWMLPLRDAIFFGIWLAGFAGNTVVWRGERFLLRKGRLYPLETKN